jgi:hypothetical protein
MLPRYSDVRLQSEAEVGVPIPLTVRVTVDAVSPDAKKLELEVPEGKRTVEVTAVAHLNGLELTGSNRSHLRYLKVPLTGDSDPVLFELVGRQAGAAATTVDFYQETRYLGSVTAETNVKEVGAIIHAVREPVPARAARVLLATSGQAEGRSDGASGDERAVDSVGDGQAVAEGRARNLRGGALVRAIRDGTLAERTRAADDAAARRGRRHRAPRFGTQRAAGSEHAPAGRAVGQARGSPIEGSV